MQNDDWRVWDEEREYGEVFLQRATGDLPEMESSKAATKVVAGLIGENEKVLDVGCGTGHYLRSLINGLKSPFKYEGVDATQLYIDMAKKAWDGADEKNENLLSAEFQRGDIFNIPVADGYAEVVMCNNVLLHLPSVVKPINELIRASSKHVVIRALIGNTSFRIKQVNDPETFEENGEPENFHFYNIYSEAFIGSILDKIEGIEKYEFMPDNDYKPENLTKSHDDYSETPKDITTVLGGLQVNNYIIQPWQFLVITKK